MDVKQAMRIAREYVEQVYADTQIRDVMLEEVSTSEDGSKWYVTIGFTRPELQLKPRLGDTAETALLVGRPLERDYKQVTVDDETGEVVSMQIRSLASVI